MLIPRTTLAGAALLSSAMVGAIWAHCFKLGDPFSSIIPAMLLVIITSAGKKLSGKPERLLGLEL